MVCSLRLLNLVLCLFVGVPRCIRMDDGTENVNIEMLQTAFRSHQDDTVCVLRGSSHRNTVCNQLAPFIGIIVKETPQLTIT